MEEIKQTELNNDKSSTSIVNKAPKKNLKYMQEKDSEPVKGIFRFFETPGGILSFFFRAYKGEQPKRYALKDGEVYSIPLGVAKHLNKNGWYPVHTYTTDAEGKSIYKVGERKRRFGFQSLEFVDPEDFEVTDPIVRVEKVK
jgi:hypothetical protein